MADPAYILIVFLVSGFWHGANWTFIAWGLLHALFYIPLLIRSRNRDNITIIASDSAWPRLQEVGQIIGTFILVTLAWVLFRADSLGQAVDVYWRIFTPETWLGIELTASLSITLLLLVVFILAEWKGRMYPYALAAVVNYDKPLRLGLYYMLLFAVFFLGGEKQNFIYFQF